VWNRHTIVVYNIDATKRSKGLNTTAEEKTLTPGRLGKDRADGSRVVDTISLDDIPDLTEFQLNALVSLGRTIVV